MSRLGRRQPFKPIFGRLIRYSPAPPIGKQVIVSTGAVEASVSKHHRVFGPIFGRLDTYQPSAAFYAPRPFVISQIAVGESNRRGHQRGHTVIERRIQYAAPVAPAAAKPFIVSTSIRDDRQRSQRVFGPIFKSLIRYAVPVSTPPVAAPPKIVSFAAMEVAIVRYHRLHHPQVGEPILEIGSLTTPFLPLIRRDPKAPPVLRGFTERVTNILNSLMRKGQLVQIAADEWEIVEPGGGTNPVGANPTAIIGLSPVSGSAPTFLRSDGAPALSQGIAPTWTSRHNFTNGIHVGTQALGPDFTPSSLQADDYLICGYGKGIITIDSTGTSDITLLRAITVGSIVNVVETLCISDGQISFGQPYLPSIFYSKAPSGLRGLLHIDNKAAGINFPVLSLQSTLNQTAPIVRIVGITSTSPREQANLDATWADNTDATRKGRSTWSVWDTVQRLGVTIETSGSAAMIGFLGASAIIRQVSGADLTNNVTSGGTDDTIANYTDLVIYANDAAAIRNDIYQLARKLKQLNDALRAYGLLT